eukprot:scaffold16.g65.t1
MVEEEDLDALWDAAPRRVVTQPAAESSDDDSYFGSDEEKSENSAAWRAREAEARLRDLGGDGSAPGGGAASAALPSAGEAFDEVEGPPAFLDPEAMRPLATAVHRPAGGAGGGDVGSRAVSQAANKRGQAAGEWDISKMAPQLKEEGRAEPGVIKGAAVRYDVSDDRMQQPVSAAAIAMLGGTAGEGREDGGAAPAGGPGAARPPPGGPGQQHGVKGRATPAMAVDKFMEKGVGGAQLPRKRQDRKEKEKEKRMRGQSTHAAWKSEAEMVLRQQYD